MSHELHSNSATERWSSRRGLLIAFVVVLAVLIVLASVGSFDTAQSDADVENAIMPAGETAIPPTE